MYDVKGPEKITVFAMMYHFGSFNSCHTITRRESKPDTSVQMTGADRYHRNTTSPAANPGGTIIKQS